MYTDSLLINLILFILGLLALVKGSGWFIDGAAYIAQRFNIPDMIIGLTLVSIGTSLPELATNVYAAFQGESAVAIGNVTGSNVANVLLILGVAASFSRSIPIDRLTLHRDGTILMIIYALFAIACYFWGINGDPMLRRSEAAILLGISIWYVIHLFKQPGEVEELVEHEAAEKSLKSTQHAALIIIIGGVLVVLGAKLMVDNVVWLATERLNIPAELVSATLIAFGTSVPELAVTIAGLLKKKSDIALGNVIGSNIFNLCLIMGVTGLITPVEITVELQQFLLPVMIGTGLMLVLFMRTHWALKRWEGIAFLGAYAVFIGYNVWRCFGGA